MMPETLHNSIWRKPENFVLQSGRMLEVHAHATHMKQVSEQELLWCGGTPAGLKSHRLLGKEKKHLGCPKGLSHLFWQRSQGTIQPAKARCTISPRSSLSIYCVKATPWMTFSSRVPMFYKLKSCETKPKINILDVMSYGDSWKNSATSNVGSNYATGQSDKKAFIHRQYLVMQLLRGCTPWPLPPIDWEWLHSKQKSSRRSHHKTQEKQEEKEHE